MPETDRPPAVDPTRCGALPPLVPGQRHRTPCTRFPHPETLRHRDWGGRLWHGDHREESSA